MTGVQTGRVALVTGANGVLGRSISEALNSAGYALILHVYGNSEVAEGLSDKSAGPAATVLHADLSTPSGRSELIRSVVAHPVSVLVNNAGIVAGTAVFAAQPGDSARIIDVCYTAARELSEALFPGMLEGGFGRIVNISSVAGLVGDAGRAAYAAAKSAMLGLTRRLARQTRGNVTVNAVLPGFIAGTPAVDALGAEKVRKVVEAIPAGRMAEPSEIASLVRYLVSEDASHVNGAVLSIDGALAARASGG